jgi:vacuolar-type H+-ATPase subunit H
MQEIFKEIKQKEKDGKELVDKTKRECEEKLMLAQQRLLDKYSTSLGSFQKEAGTIFIDKKKEIENEVYGKLDNAEKERNSTIEKATVNFPNAYEFIKKNVYKNV